MRVKCLAHITHNSPCLAPTILHKHCFHSRAVEVKKMYQTICFKCKTVVLLIKLLFEFEVAVVVVSAVTP